MARLVPPATDPTSRVYPPAPAAPGGGGDTYSDWVEVSNDPGNDFWVRHNGQNGASITCALDSGNFKVTWPSSGNVQQKQSTRKGAVFVSKLHLDPWPNGVPSGETAGVFEPDACIIKVEIQFSTGYAMSGNSNLVQLGLASYASDQSGSPGMPGDWTVQPAYLRLAYALDPANTTSNNLYKVGYSGSNATTEAGIPRMKDQGGSHASGSNALVWSTTSPITGSQSGRIPIVYGAYNTADYTAMNVQNASTYSMGTADNSSKYGGKYVHLYLAFGCYATGCNTGVLNISKIRYCVQSIANRKALPGA